MKILTLITTLLLITTSVVASPIDKMQAKKRAIKFFNDHSLSIVHKTAVRDSDIKLSNIGNTSSGTPLFYVFSRPINGGFVIIAADDALDEVIGYSDDGSFPTNGELPENLRWYLSEYEKILEYAKANHINIKKKSLSPDKHNIDTLVTSLWDQGEPYNNLCPTGDYGHCYTGCVATAIAQVMYYHKWPDFGYGRNSYTVTPDGNEDRKQTLSADFSATDFEWSKMIDIYKHNAGTQASKDAVAKLMLNLGIALEMGYNSKPGSGSSPTQMKEAEVLKKHFRYSYKTTNLQYVNDSLFTEIVYNELNSGRPVLVGGTNEKHNGGHLFICDGYRTDGMFHFNWGWSGACNGYFSPSALIPGIQNFDFTYDHRLIYNIEPYYGEIPDTTFEVESPQEGLLQENMPEEANYATSLKISGKINGTDMVTLRRMTGRDEKKNATGGMVEELDLSDVIFVPGGDIYCEDYTVTSPDEFPNHGFYWSNLKKVIIPLSISEIGKNAFETCLDLKEVIIGNNIKKIDFCAFNYCKSLEKIDIPSSVECIDSYAFTNNNSLNEITLYSENPPLAYDSTFSKVTYDNAVLRVPFGTKEKYKASRCWKNFTKVMELEPTYIATPKKEEEPFDIYNVQGILIQRHSTTTQGLPPGYYIINGHKTFVK